MSVRPQGSPVQPPPRIVVAGAGGGLKGGGTSGQSAKEDKDTLTSRSFARVIDLLSEGPISGFATPNTPLQCIYLDGTPIENLDGRASSDGTTTNGSPNFSTANNRFSAADVGKGFTGDNIPQFTTIKSFTDAKHIVLSKNATATKVGNALWGVGGSLNYANFEFFLQPGTQTQPYMPGFSQQESSVGIGIRFKKLLPWDHAITDPTIDAFRVDIRFPRLQVQDPATGDIHGTSVRLQIQVESAGGGFATLVDDTIKGKASSPYLRTYRVELAGLTFPWNVRIVRVTDDSTSQSLQNETWVDSYTEITYAKIRHVNSALVGIHMDAQAFSSIPTRAYHVHGLLIKIPANYNPVARTYATSGVGTTNGVWDGTFQTAWSNNPAWCWYDMATNARYGLGHLMSAANIDKFALYTIAKYCDQKVPNGAGGLEPRMTCNLYLQKQEDAIKVLSDMAGIFRGMISYINGTLTPVQDAPSDPSAYRMFSPANVVNGVFSYMGVSLRARHNAVMVSWNDMTDVGKVKQEYVEDSAAIVAAGGQNMLTIPGMGCTSRTQARRIGLWALYAEKLLTDTVSFVTAMEGYFLKPGQIIQIQDPFRAGQVLSGRLAAATTTLLTLDRPITLLVGKTYTVGVYQPSTGLLLTATVSNASGATSTLTVPALVEAPEVESVWQVAANDLNPELFRVLGIVSKDAATCEIAAIQYNQSLYDFVDFGEALDVPPTSTLPSGVACQPPGPLLIEEIITIDKVLGVTRRLEISWTKSPDLYFAKYRLSYRFSSGNWQFQPDTVTANAVIERVSLGIYDVSVIAVNKLGSKSAPVAASYTVTADILNALQPNVTGLELWGQGNNTVFNQRDAKFQWRINAPLTFVEVGSSETLGGVQSPTFQSFEVTIWNGADQIRKSYTTSTEYTFTFEQNLEMMILKYGATAQATPNFRIEVRILDTSNKLSPPAKLTVSNPPPLPPTNGATYGTLTGASFQWKNPVVPDFDHVDIFMTANQADITSWVLIGSAPAPSTSFVYHGLNPVGDTTLRYFAVVAVDTFGNRSAMAYFGSIVPGYAVAPVSIDPPAGGVVGTVTITLTCATANVKIYYTLAMGGIGGWRLYNPAAKPTISAAATIYAYAASNTAVHITSVITRAAYTYPGSVVVTPTFSPLPGTIATQDGLLDAGVTISTPTTGCNIRYTLDGTTPSSTVGTLISASSGATTALPNNNTPNSASTTLKAIAYRAGYTDSLVVTGVYTIIWDATSTVTAAPTFSPVAGIYPPTNFPKTITITSPTPGANIRYTVDGSYPAPAPGNGTTIAAGATVSVASGQILRAYAFKQGLSNSPIVSGQYAPVVPQAQVATPTFSPVAAAYPLANYPKTITISTVTAGATIKYTVDGTTPSATNGTVGTSASVAVNQTLQAYAYKANMQDSAVAVGQYQVQGVVTNPTFNQPAGAYATYPKSVTIATLTAGATISYTLDGSTPTSGGAGILINASSGVVSVAAGQTLKAMAFKTAMTDSGVTTGLYSLIPAVCATPTFSPVAAAYPYSQFPKTITIATTTPGSYIRYTLDGSTPTQTAGVLIAATSGTVSVPVDTTLNAMAFKQNVTATDSAIATGAFTMAARCTTPTFSPVGGAYPAGNYPKAITITSTAGSTIHYTTDGSTPTPTYGGTIASGGVANVSSGQTLKAIAFKTGLSDSFVASAAYSTSVNQVATPVLSPSSGTWKTGSIISVTVSCATPGATIRYNKGTSGSVANPTSSSGTIIASGSAVSVSIPVGGGELIAIAYKSGMTDSALADSIYDSSN